MIGPYFVVHLHRGSPGVPCEEFLQPLTLGSLVDDVARRLGTAEQRVAVSSMQYELAERLWSVVLGCWVTEGLIPDLDQLRYGRSPVGRIRLYLQNPTARERPEATPTETAEMLAEVVLGQLSTVHLALRSVTRVSPGLLWGNAAAALGLATRTLLNRGGCHERLYAVSEALLAMPPLADRLDGDLTARMVRRSCCLYYRTAARRACGDCPLRDCAAVGFRA
jgi:ferric iron reductase protein FhuF